MKYYPKAVEFHGMDMALANDLERLETLPFRTQQLILMSVGREAIGFVVDGTEATPELIKDAFKSACDFHLRAEKEGRTA